MLTTPMVVCGNTSMNSYLGNFVVDVRNPNTYIYFRVNGQSVASLTSRNQLLLDDPNRYGLDMKSNDISQVYRLDSITASLNTTVVNTITGTHASFTVTLYAAKDDRKLDREKF